MKLHLQGHDAYCYTGGKDFDPTLPSAVFIHGAQNDHSVWALQTRYFAHHGFGVLAVDLPGHGRSKGLPLSSIEAQADWLLELLGAAGASNPVLIGHSMGSLIALETAARAPDRIRKIALVGTAYPMKVSPALLETARNDQACAIDMVNIWSHSTIAAKPSCPAPGFYLMGAGLRLKERIAKRNAAPVFYTDFVACNSYANGEAAAADVRCDTLFVLGKRDVMTPPKAANILMSTIKNSQTILIDRCGHELMAEQPDTVLDALYEFAVS